MNSSRSRDIDASPQLSEPNEDVVVVNLTNCLAQVVGELNALKTPIFNFASQIERKFEESSEASRDGGVLKRENGAEADDSTAEDGSVGDSAAEEEKAGSLDGASENSRGKSRNNNNTHNNNSSAVPNKNENVPEKDKENARNQFGNLVAAYRAIDAKVLTDLISLMLASEVFVTDTQLNRWKKKQCTEVFYIPMKSGAEDPAEYLGSDLQEDLTNLQLLYGLLWAQLTEKLPLVTTLFNCIGEKLRRTRPLLGEYCDDGGKSQPFQASSTPFMLMQTAMAVQKRMIERCLVIENQPGPLVKKERRTTVRVRLLLNPKHLPIGSDPQLMAYLLTEDDAASFHRTKFVPTDCKLVMRNQSFVCLAGPSPSSPSPSSNHHGSLAQSSFGSTSINIPHFGVELSKLLIEKSHVDRSKAQGAPCRKYCLVFKADGFKLHVPSDVVDPIYLISQPFVITTHTNQEPESWAPIFWDRAFQDPDRVPFQTPSQVDWKRGFESLSMFFMSRSGRWLFDRLDTEEYFAQMLMQRVDGVEFLAYEKLISKHPKSTALGSGSIWKWVFGVLQLLNQEVSAPGSHDHHTQKVVTSSFNMLSPLGEPELRQLWRRGFIYGFISRSGAEKLLQPSSVPLGTFLVRFSGTEFGAVVVTWKQTATEGTEVKNILWTKEHLRKQSFLTRLKYLVNTARQLPLFYLYRGPDSFLPINDAFGDLWDRLEKMDDGVGNRGNAKPGYVAHYDSIIDKIDLSEIPGNMVIGNIDAREARRSAVGAPQSSSSPPPSKKEILDSTAASKAASRQSLLAAISEASSSAMAASRANVIRDSLPRLFIPSPSPSLALAIAASSAADSLGGDFSSVAASATAMKTLISNLGDRRHHPHQPLTPVSPCPSSSSTSSATKNKLRAVIFNRSMSLPHGTSARLGSNINNNNNNNHLDAQTFLLSSSFRQGESSPGFTVSPSPAESDCVAAKSSPSSMTDQEHQVVESLLSLRSAASPVASSATAAPQNGVASIVFAPSSPSSNVGSAAQKPSNRRKRKLAPMPAASTSGVVPSTNASRHQRLLYVPSATFPLPASSFSFPASRDGHSSLSAPVILSPAPSTPTSLPASPPFPPSPSPSSASSSGAANARSISPQDRHLAESLLSLSKGVPPPKSTTSASGVDADSADECQAMDLSTHSDVSANGTK